MGYLPNVKQNVTHLDFKLGFQANIYINIKIYTQKTVMAAV